MWCNHCHYRLKGLKENRCPECGEPFDPNDPETFDPGPKPLPRWWKILVVAYLVLYTVGFAIKAWLNRDFEELLWLAPHAVLFVWSLFSLRKYRD